MTSLESFKKRERIKSTLQFKYIFKNGKRSYAPDCKVFYLRNNLMINRVAFTLPRGYGNSVERNRSRRLSREVYRTQKPYLSVGFDMIFKFSDKNCTFAHRKEQFNSLATKIGILKDLGTKL